MKINYTYEMTFRRTPVCRKICRRYVDDVADISPIVLENTEFPLAFIVHDVHSLYPGMTGYNDNEHYVSANCHFGIVPEEFRVYNDKLYRSVRVSHGAAVSNLFENPDNYLREQLGQRFARYHNEDDTFCEQSVVVSCNREQIIQNIKKEMSRFIVCDGKIWELTGEPRYVINTFGLGYNHGGTSLSIDTSYNGNIGKNRYFNALQYEQAVEIGKQIARDRGDTNDIDRIGVFHQQPRYIEVLMPEMVKCDPQAEHGDGDPFINRLEGLVRLGGNPTTAGMLCILETCSEIRN